MFKEKTKYIRSCTVRNYKLSTMNNTNCVSSVVYTNFPSLGILCFVFLVIVKGSQIFHVKLPITISNMTSTCAQGVCILRLKMATDVLELSLGSWISLFVSLSARLHEQVCTKLCRQLWDFWSCFWRKLLWFCCQTAVSSMCLNMLKTPPHTPHGTFPIKVIESQVGACSRCRCVRYLKVQLNELHKSDENIACVNSHRS